jgi:hypothetical protein
MTQLYYSLMGDNGSPAVQNVAPAGKRRIASSTQPSCAPLRSGASTSTATP